MATYWKWKQQSIIWTERVRKNKSTAINNSKKFGKELELCLGCTEPKDFYFLKRYVGTKLYFFLVSLSLTGLRKINREHTRKETKVKNDSVTSRVSADNTQTLKTHKHTHSGK